MDKFVWFVGRPIEAYYIKHKYIFNYSSRLYVSKFLKMRHYNLLGIVLIQLNKS